MTAISRRLVLLAGVVFCGLLMVCDSAGPVAEAQAKENVQPEEPYKHSRVLVEAFVVEVRLSALYDLGVNPIGQKPESVSVDNIQKCLRNKDWAQVTAGAKLALGQDRRGTTKSAEKIYVERQASIPAGRGRDGAVSTSLQSYSVGKSFSAQVNVSGDRRIFVEYDFGQNTLDEAELTSDAPPATKTRDWSGSVCLEAGKPSIVGAVQNEKMAVFLIISADMRCE